MDFSSDYTVEAEQETVQILCLPEGDYEFTIEDSRGDGIRGGYYNLTSGEDVIVRGDDFGYIETTVFSLPFRL